MQLSIVSLNYKKPQLTLASMQSLYEQYKEQFEKKEFEYIVVDNHSEDDSAKILPAAVKKYTGFHFIENPQNNGFGAGNNLGAMNAKGKYVLFLNNDTQIKGKGVAEMLSCMERDAKVAILGGELRNFDGTSQPSVGKFYTLFPLMLLLLGMQRFGLIDKNPEHVSEVEWVKGALLMIRKEVFEKLHGFDEAIFMYTEDMELCFRAKQKGYHVFFYPTEGILHKDQGSSNRTFAIVNIYANILYFYKKHRPVWEVGLVKLLLQTKAILLILYGKLLKKEYFVATYEKALASIR